MGAAREARRRCTEPWTKVPALLRGRVQNCQESLMSAASAPMPTTMRPPRPDGELEGELVNLCPKLTNVSLGGKLGHDELPDGLGVSLGLLLRHSLVAQPLAERKGIEGEYHQQSPSFCGDRV
jgi:hypothetical protein